MLGMIGLGAVLANILAQNTPATDPSSGEIIQFLSQTIDWYRQTQQEQHIATEPADLGFLADNRRTATQITRLAFDFARQEEQRLAKQEKTTSTATPSANVSQNDSLYKAASDADQLVQQTQAEVETLKKKLATVSAAERRHLENQVAETESELALFQARQQALHTMLEFASGASGAGGSSGLHAQIEELARAVPPAASGLNGGDNPPDQQQSLTKAANKATPSGIWGLTTQLFRLSSKRGVLTNELRATDALQHTSMQIRQPLRAHLKQLIQSGNQLAQQADTSDQNALAEERKQLDSLTAEFKQASGLIVPLGKQGILLDLYKRSLSNWQQEVDSEFKENLKGLLARVGGVAIALGAVLIFGEVWRRTIFRYVHDVRRRYQFLLMRKIAIWCAVALVLMFAFVTELGTVATFAGLITAGVAVALQNVIVSMVGYFFLIGRFGIRVGDRVQVGSVTGEVVDIGLVRFHLLELSGNTADSEPTGRVVAFSNSVVFQAGASLFKQIPGTNFIWREIVLKFATDNDYREIRERVQKAIDSAFSDYRDSLERQKRQMELSLTSISTSELKPSARVHFTTSATEVIVRYPVIMDKAVETDERIIGDIFAAVNREPRLNLLNAEVPTSKAAT